MGFWATNWKHFLLRLLEFNASRIVSSKRRGPASVSQLVQQDETETEPVTQDWEWLASCTIIRCYMVECCRTCGFVSIVFSCTCPVLVGGD